MSSPRPFWVWLSQAATVAVNSIADGSVLGGAGGGISLTRNTTAPVGHRLLWAGIHIAALLSLNAWLDVKAWMKAGHPIPNLFDPSSP